MFSTLYEVVVSVMEYCTFKTQLINREVQHVTVAQTNTISDEEVEKIADEFTLFWLSQSPSDLPRPRSLHLPKK